MLKCVKNGFFWDNSIIKKVSNFTRRYIYLQLEKPSGIESEMPNPEALAMDWLKSGQKGPPLGSDRVKCLLNFTCHNMKLHWTLCMPLKGPALFQLISWVPGDKGCISMSSESCSTTIVETSSISEDWFSKFSSMTSEIGRRKKYHFMTKFSR